MRLPKQVQEAKRLDQDSSDGPFYEDQYNATEETYSPSELLLSCKEIECLGGSDDKGKARHE